MNQESGPYFGQVPGALGCHAYTKPALWLCASFRHATAKNKRRDSGIDPLTPGAAAPPLQVQISFTSPHLPIWAWIGDTFPLSGNKAQLAWGSRTPGVQSQAQGTQLLSGSTWAMCRVRAAEPSSHSNSKYYSNKGQGRAMELSMAGLDGPPDAICTQKRAGWYFFLSTERKQQAHYRTIRLGGISIKGTIWCPSLTRSPSLRFPTEKKYAHACRSGLWWAALSAKGPLSQWPGRPIRRFNYAPEVRAEVPVPPQVYQELQAKKRHA